MTAPAPRWDAGFAHPALFYRGTAEYLEGTVAFIRAGLAADEPVALAVPGPNLRLILTELGTDAEFLDGRDAPFFLTWTQTRGADPHTDVSLWFLLRGQPDQMLDWDAREFAGIRWWSASDIQATPEESFDPNQQRFLAKVQAHGLWTPSGSPGRSSTGEPDE